MRFLALLLFLSLFPPAVADENNLPRTTLFYDSVTGVGAIFGNQDGHATVQSLLTGSPAEKAGLKRHDIVVQVDGKNVEGMKLAQVVALIRGPAGSNVNIVVKRQGATLPPFTITRETMRVRRASSAVSPQGTQP